MSLASTRLTMLLTASLNFSSSVKMGMLSLTTLSTRLSPTACRATGKLHSLHHNSPDAGASTGQSVTMKASEFWSLESILYTLDQP